MSPEDCSGRGQRLIPPSPGHPTRAPFASSGPEQSLPGRADGLTPFAQPTHTFQTSNLPDSGGHIKADAPRPTAPKGPRRPSSPCPNSCRGLALRLSLDRHPYVAPAPARHRPAVRVCGSKRSCGTAQKDPRRPTMCCAEICGNMARATWKVLAPASPGPAEVVGQAGTPAPRRDAHAFGSRLNNRGRPRDQVVSGYFPRGFPVQPL